jgi:GDP-L-fucose synthase
MFEDKTILVAGATGLAGTSILELLLKECPGVRFKALYYRTAPFLHDPSVQYIQANLTKRGIWQEQVQGCDMAILAAAETGGAYAACHEPHRQVTDNIVMDSLLLETLERVGVKRAVYLSSATVYQEFDGAVREDDLDMNLEPHPAYLGVGWAKRAAEKLCLFWHHTYDIKMTVLRCANIYGPYDRFVSKQANFIPALIQRAESADNGLEVWGRPEVCRDVLFGFDLAKAVLTTLAQEQNEFTIYNVGSGQGVTVGQVAGLIASCAGINQTAITFAADRPSTISKRILNCDKLQSATGWKPETDFQTGIVATFYWWRNNKSWWKK